MPQPLNNPATPAKVALGRQLFTDPRLSGSGRTACQSCHRPEKGWADGQIRSVRDDGQANVRNTPSLYNVGYQKRWNWDGSATTLEAQILVSWRVQLGADPARTAAVMNAVPGYRRQFAEVWGTGATPQTIVKALAAFVRSLVSDDSAWDRHEAGVTGAVPADAIAGEALFAGRGRCTVCHSPPYYGNSTFFNVGLEHGKPDPDPGRLPVSRLAADRSVFKTPGLRSVALTAPYFHDGSAATLDEAVHIMAAGGRPDPGKTDVLQPAGLTDTEIEQIVAFLSSLTSRQAWVQPALP